MAFFNLYHCIMRYAIIFFSLFGMISNSCAQEYSSQWNQHFHIGIGELNKIHQEVVHKSLDDLIVGVWKSKKDPESQWTFTADSTLKSYYGNELIATWSYSVYSSLPDCGVDWDNPNPDLKFLVLKKREIKLCYTILGLSKKNLTLSPFRRGQFLIFIRKSDLPH